ncbi:MAG: MFS transporter [Eubacteriales bacterium]|nr:MFS transporter [Eubacteriales bacterium]
MNQPRLWTQNFAAIFSISFFLFMNFMMLQLLLPVHMNRLGASDSTVGVAMALFMASGLLIRPFAGVALDHWGRRPILMISLLAMLLFTLSYGWLGIAGIIVIRFLQGFAWATVTNSATTIVSDQLPAAIYGMGFGVFSLATGSAMALAPLLAFPLFSRTNFRTLTFAAALIIVIGILIIPLLKYPKRTPQKAAPLLRGRLVEKSALIPALAVLLSNITYGAVSGFVVLYGEEQGLLRISIFFTVFALVLMASRPLFGHLVDLIGYPRLLYPALASITTSLILLALRPDLFLLSAVLLGLGDSGVQASLNTLAITRSDPQRLGAANATFFTGFDTGIGVGSLIGGLLASALGYSTMFLIIAVFPLLAGLVAVLGLRKAKAERV